MLKYVALIIANPKYDSLITVSQSTLTIHNQYIFLWNVLPKISEKFTRRTQFVREMKTYGFELINQKSDFNKQNNIDNETQSQKNLTFKAKCYEFIASLKKIEEIKRKRITQKQILNQKLKSLQSKFRALKQSSSANVVKQFELFDEVSSLNSINRNILMQNQEISSLISSCFELKNINIGYQTTYEILANCLDNQNMLPLAKHKMKSSNHLVGFKNKI